MDSRDGVVRTRPPSLSVGLTVASLFSLVSLAFCNCHDYSPNDESIRIKKLDEKARPLNYEMVEPEYRYK